MSAIAKATFASFVLLLVAGMPAAMAGQVDAIRPGADPAATLAQLVQDVGGRGAAAQATRYDYLRKIDGHLQNVAVSRLGGGSAAAATVAARREGVKVSAQGEVLVDVYANGDLAGAERALRALGMRVTAVSSRAPERMVEGFLPAAMLAPAAGLASTHAILSTFGGGSGSGSVMTQGDAAIHGPAARAFGATGAGVLVGIVSTSINQVGGGVGASQASGDLPPRVDVLVDDPGDDDEGRAMAEIVYDEAPGISGIAFATGLLGTASKAASIDSLAAHGARVIADDIYWLGEPFFQDGIITQAVDRAKAAGVAYFALAGNFARDSWEGTYTGGATEDFDPGAGTDTVQTVGTIAAGDDAWVSLEWAEPWGHATTNFAIDVYVIGGGAPAFSFTVDSDNIATGIPLEFADIHANSAITYGIAIRRVAGTGNPLLKYIAAAEQTVNIEHPTHSPAIAPDAGAASGALTVSASQYTTPTTPEAFSSRGPVTHFFDANGTPLATPDVRAKPNVGGPDGVATTVPSFVQFFGTSAATPAVAGIAALMLSAKPAMPVDEVYAILTAPGNSLDCTATAGSPDFDCGVGFALADKAMAMTLDATPPVVTPSLAPAAPDGANGWYRAPVSVSWAVSDAESPVVDPAGCTAASVGDGIASLTCSATSAGGTTSVPLTIKRDSTAPGPPGFTGITARAYASSGLPRASSVGCSATDPTSGIASCTVSGFQTGLGSHRLTAIATNGAGLTTTSSLTYSVTRPAAISRLALPKGLGLAKIMSGGIPLTLKVATAKTKLVVKVVARVRKPGHAPVAITLATLTKRVSAGTVHLRLTLTPAARQKLSGVAKATLSIVVAGTSQGAKGTSLRSSVVVKR